MIQATTYHRTPASAQKLSHPCRLPSELRRRIGDGSVVGIGEVGVSLPDTSVTPTIGESRVEDDERERLTYGLGDGFSESICGDNGVATTSASSGGVYVSSSRTALGGGRSTIASRS